MEVHTHQVSTQNSPSRHSVEVLPGAWPTPLRVGWLRWAGGVYVAAALARLLSLLWYYDPVWLLAALGSGVLALVGLYFCRMQRVAWAYNAYLGALAWRLLMPGFLLDELNTLWWLETMAYLFGGVLFAGLLATRAYQLLLVALISVVAWSVHQLRFTDQHVFWAAYDGVVGGSLLLCIAATICYQQVVSRLSAKYQSLVHMLAGLSTESGRRTADLEMRTEVLEQDAQRLRFHAQQLEKQLITSHATCEKLRVEKLRAEEASRTKEQFLANMSHEIRTPLNAIVGITNLLLSEEPRSDQMNNLHTLQFSAQNLLAIINDILDFSKIEAGKVDFEQLAFRPADLLSKIRKSFALPAREKGIALRLLQDDSQPEWLVGDPTRLTQVIVNLMSNALKFTKQGSITLETEVCCTGTTGTELAITVTDTGIGIAPDKQQVVFDMFTQASDDTTRHFGGTGLGLAITRRLVELQGGVVSLNSAPGVGSAFTVVIPFGRATGGHATADLEVEETPRQERSLEGLRVLVVDDNPINLQIARQMLAQWGAHVTTADSGTDCLRQCAERPFDLILMDIQMPDIDGFETTRRLHVWEQTAERTPTPVVALTASVSEGLTRQAREAGMADALVKPFEPMVLRSKVARHARPPHTLKIA